jgi:Crp-like helix-turn-helix domain
MPGLTHETIASLVAASRPSVTKAFGDLRDRGLLERRPRGILVLHGAPRDGLIKRSKGERQLTVAGGGERVEIGEGRNERQLGALAAAVG